MRHRVITPQQLSTATHACAVHSQPGNKWVCCVLLLNAGPCFVVCGVYMGSHRGRIAAESVRNVSCCVCTHGWLRVMFRMCCLCAPPRLGHHEGRINCYMWVAVRAHRSRHTTYVLHARRLDLVRRLGPGKTVLCTVRCSVYDVFPFPSLCVKFKHYGNRHGNYPERTPTPFGCPCLNTGLLTCAQ